MRSHSDRLFMDTVENLRRKRHMADQAQEKTSQQKKVPTAREKLSSIKSRNEDHARVGKILVALGQYGFEKVAMESLKLSEGNPSGWDTSGDPGPPAAEPTESTANGAPAQAASAGSVTEQMASGGSGSSDPSSNEVTIARMSRGGPRPDNLVDMGNPSTTEANPESTEPTVGFIGEPGGKDLADGSANTNLDNLASKESSAKLRTISGGKYIESSARDQSAYLRRLGLKNSDDAFNVFVKTAAKKGKTLNAYLTGLELNSFDKKSLMREIALEKMSQGKLDGDISAAKNAVEAVVKATGTLPDASAVAQAAGVDPMAANIAIFETGELIAATGGQVAGAAGPTTAAPMSEDVGAMPPGAGQVEGAPMAPPAGTPPPVDPAMMQPPMPMGDPMAGGAAPPAGAPPMPPQDGMVAQASVGNVKLADDQRARLRGLITRLVKNSASASLEGMSAEEPTAGSGVRSNSEGVLDPGPEVSTDSALQLTPADRSMVDSVLGSNAGVLGSDQAEIEAHRHERADQLVDTGTSNPGTKGELSSSEDVKSTFEGNVAPSSATAGEAYEASKASGLPPEFLKKKGEGSDDSDDEDDEAEAKDDSDDDEKEEEPSKESARVRRIIADMFPSLTKQSFSSMYADGNGTSDVSSVGGDVTTGSGLGTPVKKAVSYVKKEIQEKGRVPSSQDVMTHAGVNEDEAKTAIARGAEND